MERILVCGLLLVLPCLGQGRGNPMQLVPQKALRKGVAAVPLIAHPADEAQRKINASLQEINDGLRPALKECDADYAGFAKEMRENGVADTAKDEISQDWKRRVTVTSAGPRYLSLLISDFDFCGGVHPNFSESTPVFDLETGEPVDWVAMMPLGRAKLEPASPWNGIPAQQITDAALKDFYVARLSEPECRKIVAEYDDVSLLIWLDAAKRRLMLETNLPHVSEACAEHVALTADEAGGLGFAEKLLRGIVR